MKRDRKTAKQVRGKRGKADFLLTILSALILKVLIQIRYLCKKKGVNKNFQKNRGKIILYSSKINNTRTSFLTFFQFSNLQPLLL